MHHSTVGMGTALADGCVITGGREKVSTALFFQYNSQLGPPYQVLVDTNFINFAIKNKVCIYVVCWQCTVHRCSAALLHLVSRQHRGVTRDSDMANMYRIAACVRTSPKPPKHYEHHYMPLPPQIDLVQGMMDCLYAECTPCITECVMAELEKLGQHYRVALKVAKVRRAWLTSFRSVFEFA